MEDESFRLLLSAINDPDITTEELITNEQFQAAMRKEYPPLIEFLKKDKTITDLANWCFDPKLSKDPRFKKISYISIYILTSTMPSIFQIFVKSHIFANIIHDFLLSDASNFPMQCGFLARILSQETRWGDPIIFKDFPDVGILLVKNIKSIAIQDIIVTISAREQISLYNEMNLILLLSEIMISEMNEAAATVLQQIYDNIDDDSPIIKQYCNSQVISNIVDFCLSSKWIVLSLDLLEVAVHVVENNMELFPIIEKHKNILEIKKDNITVFSVMMIPLFVRDVIDLFTLFFEPDAYKYLHQHCSSLVLELSPDEILRISQLPNFVDHLIDIYNTDHWCHHMMELVVVFTRILPYYGNLNPKWANFFGTYGKRTVKILQDPYGGPVPDANITDRIMNDLFESQLQEEEEEEEIEENSDEMNENKEINENEQKIENEIITETIQSDEVNEKSQNESHENVQNELNKDPKPDMIEDNQKEMTENVQNSQNENDQSELNKNTQNSQNENDQSELNKNTQNSQNEQTQCYSSEIAQSEKTVDDAQNPINEIDKTENVSINEKIEDKPIENEPNVLTNETETNESNDHFDDEYEEDEYEEEEYEKVTIMQGNKKYLIRGVVYTDSDFSSETNDSDEDMEFDLDDD